MVAVLFRIVLRRDAKRAGFQPKGTSEVRVSANDQQPSPPLGHGWPPTSARQADAEEGLY